MFVDWTKVNVKSGNGGSGCVAFRREKHVPKGGPSGGDGGKGGDIIFEVDSNLFTLQDIKYRKSYKAPNGGPGQGSRKTGQDGQSLIIKVPPGTVVIDEATHEVVADLTETGSRTLIAEGGKGGKGNASFARATNRTPRFSQAGQPGVEKRLIIELKVISDVGLVGFPNAGKSTLISKISAATPKIADYPFTTLTPHLGIVKYGNYRSFIMADIPGLIKGAHAGKGLGYRFLRHLERTRLLIFLIDISSDDIVGQYHTLNAELDRYSPVFRGKPRLLVLSKGDLTDQVPGIDLPGINILTISAVNGGGLEDLIQRIVQILESDV
ncbi:MAG TPA: GTPase ObgE [Candidatus Marinimicrobia bacterium]|nr:GTPase ObgE [Candidatus Neomarinimicrobiota bacterium]